MRGAAVMLGWPLRSGYMSWGIIGVNRLLIIPNHVFIMSIFPAPLSRDAWLVHLFSSQAAREGGVIRRKIRDIDRYVGREAFLREMQRRGYPVVENAGQFVIFCNQEPIRRVM